MRNSIKMNKLKYIITELLKNEKIKIFFNKVIHLIKRLKQHVVINNLINKTVNFVKQHKAISVAIAVSVIAIPPLITPTSHYPKECRGLTGETDYRGGMPWNDNYVPELSLLAFEEDPKLLLGKKGGMFTYYDDDILPELFEAKYSRLVTSSGKKSAEIYREQLAKACQKYREE